MYKYSFRVIYTRKAQADGKCYIASVMDDYGNDFVVDTAKVNHFLAPLH